MPIYSDTDFKNDDELEFDPRLEPPGPASQDLHVGRLFRHERPDNLHTKEGQIELLESLEDLDVDASWSKFRRSLEKVPKVNRNGEDVWILGPGKAYLGETVEKITLPEGLAVDVDTRSSWARFGLRAQHMDDELEYFTGYEGHIPLLVTTRDVPIVLRPNDRICQAVVYEWDKGMLRNEEIYEAYQTNEIDCYLPAPHDPQKKLPCLNVEGHAIRLSLDPVITRFRGDVIDPKEDQSGNYVNIDIKGGYEIPYEEFFLGSSNEVVEIGDKYAGLLRDIHFP